MSPMLTAYDPKVRVQIKDLATGSLLYDVSDDLVSLSTNKAYGRAAGTWQMILAYKMIDSKNLRPVKSQFVHYHEGLIIPDDLVSIEIDAGSGDGFIPVMLGMVDRVSMVWSGGVQPSRQIKVSGQDMGKILVKHDIGWDINLNKLFIQDNGESTTIRELSAQSRLFNPEFQMGDSGKIISNLFRETFQKDVTASQYIKFQDISNDTWTLWQPELSTLKGTSLWDAMKRVSHTPINMLTTDTTGVDEFTIYLESQPIDVDGAGKANVANLLQFYTVEREEIVSSDVGICDAERVNFLFYAPTFYANSINLGVDVLMGFPDLVKYDSDSIKLHGYCLHAVDDVFVPFTDSGVITAQTSTQNASSSPGSLADFLQPTLPTPINYCPAATSDDLLPHARKITEMLWHWYRNNHTYESGAFALHVRPEISVGEGLLVKDGDSYMEYFIEQVAHSCSFHPQPKFTTELHVTRGQTASDANKGKATK